MNLPLLALTALVSVAPSKKPAAAPAAPAAQPAPAPAKAAPFEGYLFYKSDAQAKPVEGSRGRPVGGGQGMVKLAVSPRGVRSETRFNNNGRSVANTVLVTGSPPVPQMWNEGMQRFVPMSPPPQATKGEVKSELLGREKMVGLDTVHVRIMEGAEVMELWTAPGLVDDAQMDQIFATSSRLSPVVAGELKKLGAWGPVVRSVRGAGVVQLERLERTPLNAAIFSPSTPPVP
ncbi:MAG: hypothetical protein RL653_1079 [Pseudomonadota bacterium]|jgi:hypothetical protein